MKIPTFKITGIAVLGALSAILFYFDIPVLLFYKFDFSNLPVLIGTFAYGSVGGLFILLIKDLTGLLHSSTAGVGELADLIISLVFVIICGLFYKNNRTKTFALYGMLLSTIIAAIVAVLVNKYLLIPLLLPNNGMQIVTNMGNKLFPFINTPFKFLMLITMPFNIIKGIVISTITYLIYKKISPILHKTYNS